MMTQLSKCCWSFQNVAGVDRMSQIQCDFDNFNGMLTILKTLKMSAEFWHFQLNFDNLKGIFNNLNFDGIFDNFNKMFEKLENVDVILTILM